MKTCAETVHTNPGCIFFLDEWSAGELCASLHTESWGARPRPRSRDGRLSSNSSQAVCRWQRAKGRLCFSRQQWTAPSWRTLGEKAAEGLPGRSGSAISLSNHLHQIGRYFSPPESRPRVERAAVEGWKEKVWTGGGCSSRDEGGGGGFKLIWSCRASETWPAWAWERAPAETWADCAAALYSKLIGLWRSPSAPHNTTDAHFPPLN